MLLPWEGRNSKSALTTLRNKISDACSAQQSSVFGWYMNFVSPELTKVAEAEGQGNFDGSMANYPMTMFCLYFVQRFQIYGLENLNNTRVVFTKEAITFFKEKFG